MGLRHQAKRLLKARASKLHRTRKSRQHRYRPLLESLESRMLMTGFWSILQPTNPSNGPVAGIQTMSLLSNGVVMAAQNTAPNPGSPANTSWFQLPPTSNGQFVNSTWTSPSTMNQARLYFPSAMLPDGRIFAIGGEYSPTTGFVNAPEIFNPLTNTWTRVADMPSPPTQAAVPPSVPPTTPQSQFGDDPIEVLPNGDILAGWFNGPNTFVYNVASNTWRSTTGTKLRNDASDEESWVKLPDGSILSYDIFASSTTGQFHAQRFDPAQDTWVDASNVDTNNPPPILSNVGFGFELGPGVLLHDGRVIYFGANGTSAYYDSKTGIWSKGPDLPFDLSRPALGPLQMGATDDPAAVLPNGKVLVALSVPIVPTTPNSNPFNSPTRIFELDPSNNTFTDVTPFQLVGLSFGNLALNDASIFTMLVLPTGQVLLTSLIPTTANTFVGGPDFLYTPDGGPLDAWRPTIQSITDNKNGTFTLSGTQLNGLSEGAYYGDDAEMATNYPLLRMTDKSGNIVYARTFNWSSTGVQTGSKVVTTQFTLPSGTTLNDFNDFTVVANGIPSAAFHFSFTTAQTISGVKFNDLNGDGIRETGEPAVSHVTIFLDLNNDGKLSIVEPAAVTDNFGRFSFTKVPPGNYVVREVIAPGQSQTLPGPNATVPFAHSVTLIDRAATGMDFGDTISDDFGDAPDSYGTTLLHDGARHGILAGFHLGVLEDGEPDGQPTADATGDDQVNAITGAVDDEDGVFISPLTPGQPANITVTVSLAAAGVGSSPGKLQGWIDWNQNGKFDAGEKIISNLSLGAGPHVISINVPATAKLGSTFARFRYAYESDLGPTGAATAGEDEDYQVTVLPSVPIATPDVFPRPIDIQQQGLIKPTSVNYKLDVLANDVGTAFGTPKIVPGSIVLQTPNEGSTFTIAFDATLGRQVILYTPGPGVTGGDQEQFTYQVTDGHSVSAPGLVTINVALADNIAIDDTFTLGATGLQLNAQLSVMQNDLTSHPVGEAQVIAVDARQPSDLTGNGDPSPPPPGQTSVTLNGTTLSIDPTDPTKLDFSAPSTFRGTVIFKYEIDEDPANDDPTTGPSTRYVTVQVVDGQVLLADPGAFDASLVSAGYLAELDVAAVSADAGGNPTDNTVVQVSEGDTFYLRVTSHDLRAGGDFNNRGVVSAYLDMLLNPGSITVNGTAMSIRNFASPLPDDQANPMSAIVFTNEYNNAPNGQNGVNNAPRAPEFNEVGAFHQDPASPAPRTDLTGFPDVFFVRMMAKQATPAGQPLQVAGDPADNPIREVAIRDNDPANQVPVVLTDEQVFLRPTTLTISPAGQPEFFNSHNPMDVNQDHSVSPIDALTVINYINARVSGPLLGAPVQGQMVDTNMDGILSPVDVLGVVNYLNAFLVSNLPAHYAPSAGGEGEGEAGMAALVSGWDDSSSSSTSSGTTSSSAMLLTNASPSSGSFAAPSTVTGSDDSSSASSMDIVDAGAADELYASLTDMDGDTTLNGRKR
jgi:hypothetical protein